MTFFRAAILAIEIDYKMKCPAVSMLQQAPACLSLPKGDYEYVRFERTRVTMKIKGDNMWFAWCEHSWSIFPSVSSGMSKIGKGLGKNYCIANMHLDYGS